jgi:PPP family 3-phenylpropionic acid transporter
MPYWRLSGFYFFYFATVGVLVPYWALYLDAIGFSAIAIGQLMALLMISRIVAPIAWGWLADHRAQRLQVIRFASGLTIVAFSGVFFGQSFAWLAVVMLLFSFFWNASLPLLEVITMNHLRAHAGAYGRVRLWGSIGFIATVLTLGPVVDRFGPTSILPALMVLMSGIWIYSLWLPESEAAVPAEQPESFWRVIMRPPVLAFLVTCFLMQASHGPYYTFYSILLERFGYTKSVIGMLWAFGVVCEIGLFMVIQQILARVELRHILLGSFFLAAVRWLLIGWNPENLAILINAQILHAASFGAFHAGAIQLVYRFFRGRHQHRGQAVYGSASFGLGGAFGSLYSGYAWELLGPAYTFTLAAGIAVLAGVIAFAALRPRT